MTETSLALCKSALTGVFAWLAGQCANNQALDAPKVDLTQQGPILVQAISVPMNERYEFGLQFRFVSREAYENTAVAGRPSGSNTKACTDDDAYVALSSDEKRNAGAEISLQVIVKSTDGKILSDGKFRSRCLQGWGELTKNRHFGYLNLAKGQYQLIVINHSPLPDEPGASTVLFLVGKGAGYP